jgi:hypothetical protein
MIVETTGKLNIKAPNTIAKKIDVKGMSSVRKE